MADRNGSDNRADMTGIVDEGWGGLVMEMRPEDPPETAQRQTLLEKSFARCFAGPDADRVLAHMRAITLERALGPGASDAAVRHLDGQRCLFLHIMALIDRGRSG